MTPHPLELAVTAALARVRNPRLEADLLSAGMIRDLAVAPDGKVAFTFLLAPEDPATLVREARAAVRAVEGVQPTEIRIHVVNPKGPPAHTHAPPQPSTPPVASQHQPMGGPMIAGLGKVLAVSSGKGGVGKSTVSANLAIALAQQGARVGIMDADIYGPNIPRMFGVFEKPAWTEQKKLQPLEAHGVKLMSLGFLVERDAPAIWRGPIIMKLIQQFLNDVEWGGLDYLVVDLPPGTGDAQLSLVQQCAVAAALIVTTPQEVAVGDALRGAKMFEKVGVPLLGIVENMSAFTDPETGRTFRIFSSGGGQRLADELGVPLLGSVPLQPGLADDADGGRPVMVSAPESPAAAALQAIATLVAEALDEHAPVLPVLKG